MNYDYIKVILIKTTTGKIIYKNVLHCKFHWKYAQFKMHTCIKNT